MQPAVAADDDALHAAANGGGGTLVGGDGDAVHHVRRAKVIHRMLAAAAAERYGPAPSPVAKIFLNKLLMVPRKSDWFSPTGVHRLERQVVPHFFAGNSPGRTPERYMMLRNLVIAKYLENPVKRIGFTECQGLVTSTVELDNLSSIVWFLDIWGIVNYFAVGPEFFESIKRELRMVNSLIREDPTGELHLMSDPLKSIDGLVLFNQPQCNIRAGIASVASTLSSPKMTNGEAGIVDLNDPSKLSYISIPPPLMEGHRDGGVVKQFLNKQLIVPWQSDWFLPAAVHRLERQGLPHLFAGKFPVYTPQKYMMLRNRVIAKYLECPAKRLSFAECQGLVTSTVELSDLCRIVRFLDSWGIINYFVAGSAHQGLGPTQPFPRLQYESQTEGVDGKIDGPKNDGDIWTCMESLPLLEGMDIYYENWNAIVEQVGTKSEAQCFLHFPWLSNYNGSTFSFIQSSEVGHLSFIDTANPGELDQQETGKSKKGSFSIRFVYLSLLDSPAHHLKFS
uniref:SWIRM domain-containing protein n=1 Tax=Oryza meridionalis TaxID=40149 RepID=A0A0E0FA33_9ORYZ